MKEKLVESINESVLCWLATVDGEGMPNASPKEVFTHYGDEIIIGNIASPESERNISLSGYACVSFINVFTQKGYKVKGCAVVLVEGEDGYNERYKQLDPIVGDKFQITNIFCIMTETVQEIVAPSYHFYPNTTERSQIESAYKQYGVKGLG